ncbi:MAG: hypothetical protein NTV98_00305 [Candidatus Roizmanbacteria bacterium]|nr:hypothetical protein [Candidatus Roizmanbacteria bacterium]
MKKRLSSKTNVKSSVKGKRGSGGIHWNWIFRTVFQIVGFIAVVTIIGMVISYMKY